MLQHCPGSARRSTLCAHLAASRCSPPSPWFRLHHCCSLLCWTSPRACSSNQTWSMNTCEYSGEPLPVISSSQQPRSRSQAPAVCCRHHPPQLLLMLYEAGAPAASRAWPLRKDARSALLNVTAARASRRLQRLCGCSRRGAAQQGHQPGCVHAQVRQGWEGGRVGCAVCVFPQKEPCIAGWLGAGPLAHEQYRAPLLRVCPLKPTPASPPAGSTCCHLGPAPLWA